jgi:hypothetical protein
MAERDSAWIPGGQSPATSEKDGWIVLKGQGVVP